MLRWNRRRLSHWIALPLTALLCACTSYRTTTARVETTAGADIGVPVADRFGVEPLEMRLHDSTFLELDVTDTALDQRSAADVDRLTLGIARLLSSGRWEGRVVDSVRVTLMVRDMAGGATRTRTRAATYNTTLLRAAGDST